MPLDIAVDMGTAKTVLYSNSKIVLEQPSVATVDAETLEPLCFGNKAYSMVGRTPDSVETVFPIEHGLIADYDVAEQMLTNYMTKSFSKRLVKPRVVVAVPVNTTSVQNRMIARVIENAGGRKVCTVESPIAAAFGLGIDSTKPEGSMIIDIGAGVTDIAIITLGRIAEGGSILTASNDFDAAIIKYVKKEFNMSIGPKTAENIKKQIGSAVRRRVGLTMVAKGVNQFTGLPETFEITSAHIYKALKDTIDVILKTTKNYIEKAAPDLVADIIKNGIYLLGGGAQLNGMDEALSKYLNINVTLVDDPSHTVVKGAGLVLRNPALLKNCGYRFRSIQEYIIDE